MFCSTGRRCVNFERKLRHDAATWAPPNDDDPPITVDELQRAMGRSKAGGAADIFGMRAHEDLRLVCRCAGRCAGVLGGAG